MTVILLKIKLTGNCLHRLSMNCLWRYDQLSHAFLLMIFYIILLIVTLSRDWNLLYVNTRMSKEGKEEKETENFGYIWWHQKGIAYSWGSLQRHPQPLRLQHRGMLWTPQPRTHTHLSPDSSTSGLGGWFGLTTILTVPHTRLPSSLVQQPPSIHFLPPSSLSSQAAQHVFVAVSQL